MFFSRSLARFLSFCFFNLPFSFSKACFFFFLNFTFFLGRKRVSFLCFSKTPSIINSREKKELYGHYELLLNFYSPINEDCSYGMNMIYVPSYILQIFNQRFYRFSMMELNQPQMFSFIYFHFELSLELYGKIPFLHQ